MDITFLISILIGLIFMVLSMAYPWKNIDNAIISFCSGIGIIVITIIITIINCCI